MKKYTNFPLCLATIAVLFFATISIEAKCNVCTEYGIACVNETSFNVCVGGEPQNDQVFTCEDNKICSQLGLRCVEPGSGTEPFCSLEKGCGICDGTKMFTCIGRTKYAQCNVQTLTTNTGDCGAGYACDSTQVEICVKQTSAEYECDRE